MRDLAAILTVIAAPAAAQTLTEAAQLSCEIRAHTQTGMDGVPAPALFPSVGEIITVDRATGTMEGAGWSDLALGPGVVQEPALTGHFVAYTLSEPKTSGAGVPFQNIRLMMIDFLSGDESAAPFMAALNGTEIVTGLCRSAG